MIEHFYKWLIASSTKHFNVKDVPLFFEGEEQLKDKLTEYVQFHIIGPDIRELDSGNYRADFTIQILISVAAGNKNKYRIHEIAGIFLKLMTNIELITFGKGPADTKEQIDCASLTKAPVRFRDFGLMQPDNKLRQAKLLGDYKIHFSLCHH